MEVPSYVSGLNGVQDDEMAIKSENVVHIVGMEKEGNRGV